MAYPKNVPPSQSPPATTKPSPTAAAAPSKTVPSPTASRSQTVSPSASASPSAGGPPSSGVSDNVSSVVARLTDAAAQLNAVSDQLSKPIEQVEAVLKKLNLGIDAWSQFAGESDYSTGYFWWRAIGYARLNGKWCIAIRTSAGSFGDPDPDMDEWPFNEAPRAYRIDGAAKLPDLLEKLVEAAYETAEKVRETKEVVQTVADVLASTNIAAPRK